MTRDEAPSAPASSDNDRQPQAAKREYGSPALVVYGSVRQLTEAASGAVGDGKGMNMAASDPAIKVNVVRIGEHPAGFGLYLFDYQPEFRDKWGQDRQFGVMADEVEHIIPEAVSMGVDGYRIVNYALLGIRRTRH